MNQEELKKQLKYDPETGLFTWIKVHPGVSWGATAGTRTKRGYIQIKFEHSLYGAHRLAWLYITGELPDRVDHKDGNPSNNKWSNLRLSTASQNSANSKMSVANTSGVKGVNWNKQVGKWCAEITINGMRHFLGYFDDIAKATAVRQQFADRMLGEFARHK